MDLSTVTNILRWVHVLAGAAWLGEVVVINVILVPTLVRLDSERRRWFLAAVFPRVFRLASVLSLTAILAGAALNLSMSGWQLEVALTRLTATRWGASIVMGGLLGLGIALFHFLVERRLEPIVSASEEGLAAETEALLVRRLQIIPRVGMGVLLLVFLLMMFAAKGV